MTGINLTGRDHAAVKFAEMLFKDIKFSILSLREKCPNTELFWSIFSCTGTEYGENLRIQSKYRKIRTRKTPHLDTFLVVFQTG